jgi:mannosyltransferase OCH1-like enzyme
MIPKVIHQIWIGPKSPPAYMDGWKIAGFDYVLWDEKAIDKLKLINQKHYDYFLKKRIYYGAADIARVEILHQYGGLYVDADTIRLRDLPDEWFDASFFAVETNRAEGKKYRVANGVMASEKGGKVMAEYIKRIKKAKKIEPCWSTIGGTMLTSIIKEYQDVLILEPYTFYPVNSKGLVHPRADEAYARHEWGSKHPELYI